tara:strand:- start:134 stop:535 length:402 start_codon:yes stop_codon:yes gene_type:complete
MKKILFITTFLILSPFMSFCQTIDDVDIREIKSEYVEVVFKGNPDLYGVLFPIKINYDFNKKLKVFRKKSNVIFNGEKVVLKTENDIINFFTSFGFDVVNEVDRSKTFGSIYNGSGTVGTSNNVVLRLKNNNN